METCRMCGKEWPRHGHTLIRGVKGRNKEAVLTIEIIGVCSNCAEKILNSAISAADESARDLLNSKK